MATTKHNLIVYGTLRDRAIQTLVAGPAFQEKFWKTATITGYRCVYVEGALYPAIEAYEHGLVHCDLYLQISPSELARIKDYEAEDYHLAEWQFDGQSFHIFLPVASLKLSRRLWDFDDFVKHIKNQYLQTLKAEGFTGFN